MAREYAEYRLVLESLIAAFGNKGWITVSELAKYEQCDFRTVKKRYNIQKGTNGIDIAVLATRKCQLAN